MIATAAEGAPLLWVGKAEMFNYTQESESAGEECVAIARIV
ncbi:MAG: hypothetical protein ACRDHE_07395 [Ktedonobacterales bacterium]